jgi:hypothetical protein
MRVDWGRDTLRKDGKRKIGSMALKGKNYSILQFFYDRPDTPRLPMQNGN